MRDAGAHAAGSPGLKRTRQSAIPPLIQRTQASRTPFPPTTTPLCRRRCPAGGRCRQTQHRTACSGGARGQTSAVLRSPRQKHRRVGEGGAVSPTGRACRRHRRLVRRPQRMPRRRRVARRPQRMPRRRRVARRPHLVQSRLHPRRREGPRESRRGAGAVLSAPALAPSPLARRLRWRAESRRRRRRRHRCRCHKAASY